MSWMIPTAKTIMQAFQESPKLHIMRSSGPGTRAISGYQTGVYAGVDRALDFFLVEDRMQFDDRPPTSSLNEAGRGNGVGQADKSQEHQGQGAREGHPYHRRPGQVPYMVGTAPMGRDEAPLAGTLSSAPSQFQHFNMPMR